MIDRVTVEGAGWPMPGGESQGSENRETDQNNNDTSQSDHDRLVVLERQLLELKQRADEIGALLERIKRLLYKPMKYEDMAEGR